MFDFIRKRFKKDPVVKWKKKHQRWRYAPDGKTKIPVKDDE